MSDFLAEEQENRKIRRKVYQADTLKTVCKSYYTRNTEMKERKDSILQNLHFLHGGDYNPDQWLQRPDILKRDIELMKEAHINCASVGIFAWASLEPEEGVYTFDWLTKVIDSLYQNGIYTVLATPSGARPAWMAQKYPEVLRTSDRLVKNQFGGRHNHCFTSPIYRELTGKIDRELARRYGHHPGVILWHISNEFGGACYCPLCQAAFRKWLRKKYGTLKQLNEAWWTSFWSHTFTDWEQIKPPMPNGETEIHGLNLDWKRFVTDQTLDFFNNEKEAVKSGNPDIPVTTNMMGSYEGLNYFKFKNAVDVVSWDSYPSWHNPDMGDVKTAAQNAFHHDLMRSLKRRPFLMMESTPSTTNWMPVSKLKRPGMHMLASMQAVALGSNSVQYFQWRQSRGGCEKFHGAVVDHYGGSDTRVFRDVKEVGERLEKLGGTGLTETCVKPQAAILFDWENRWAVEDAKGPRNAGIHYFETVLKIHKAFWDLGIPVDIADMECDLSGYRLVVAPMLYLCRAGIQEKLSNFVKNGGTLIGTYWSGVVDENDLCYLGGTPGGMMDLFGLRSEEIDALYDGETNRMVFRRNWTGKKEFGISELCELVHCSGAETLAVYGSDFYRGSPALTVNHYGKGLAYYAAARTEASFARDLIREISGRLGLKRSVETELPGGVAASRRDGEKGSFVFLQNFNPYAVSVKIPGKAKDAENGETLLGSILLAPYQTRIFRK